MRVKILIITHFQTTDQIIIIGSKWLLLFSEQKIITTYDQPDHQDQPNLTYK